MHVDDEKEFKNTLAENEAPTSYKKANKLCFSRDVKDFAVLKSFMTRDPQRNDEEEGEELKFVTRSYETVFSLKEQKKEEEK